MVSRIKCCYKCTERHAGCHGGCKRYLAEKAENEAEKEKIRAARQKQNDFVGYQKETVSHLKRLTR